MQFTVNNSDLMDGLRIVTRALGARPAKQVLEGVLIEAGDNTVTLTCSDGTLTIENTITASVAENGRAVLPGKLFTELCSKLNGGDITVTTNSTYGANVKCGRAKSNLSGMNPMEYPEMAEIGDGYTVELPQNALREMISHVVFSIATDESRQILTGCLLELSAEETRLVALDGFRLAMQKLDQRYSMPEGKPLLRSVIPGRVMNEMSKIMNDEEAPCSMLITRTHMQAAFGNTRLSTVLLAGEFIDYRKILPAQFKTTALINRGELQQAIDRASLMAREGKNNLIRMSFREDTIAVSSNAETGDMLDEIGCVLDGEPLEIAFNAKYLSDVIRNTQDEELVMCFNSSVSPCVVRPKEGAAYLYLILPVRVFQ